MEILKEKFFKNKTEIVAKNIIGKFIISERARRGLLITESEAYLGEEDLASHARFGRTKRNIPMYMNGGIWYVYLIYGVHYMLNIVTEKKDSPGAVLIRGGIGYKKNLEGKFLKENKLNGPGLVTKFLEVDLRYSNKEASFKNGLYVIDLFIKPKKIIRTSRIGIEYAGEWKHKKLRFICDNINYPQSFEI